MEDGEMKLSREDIDRLFLLIDRAAKLDTRIGVRDPDVMPAASKSEKRLMVRDAKRRLKNREYPTADADAQALLLRCIIKAEGDEDTAKQLFNKESDSNPRIQEQITRAAIRDLIHESRPPHKRN